MVGGPSVDGAEVGETSSEEQASYTDGTGWMLENRWNSNAKGDSRITAS